MKQIKEIVLQECEVANRTDSNSYSLACSVGRQCYDLAVEKAVEWLCRNMVDTDYWCINAQTLMSKPELINNLKQAMKL